MNLSALRTEAEKVSPKLTKLASETTEFVQNVLDEVRTISYLLHPPLLDEMGLESALREYVDGFRQRSGINVDLKMPADLERLPRDLETAIFRVVQECLTNIHRHSGSTTAAIRLSESYGGLTLEITDKGKGIPPEVLSGTISSNVAGVGLRGMRERIKAFGGHLEILSNGKGTAVKADIPLFQSKEKRTRTAASQRNVS